MWQRKLHNLVANFCKQGKSPDGQILNQSKLCHSFIHNLSSCVHLFHSGLIFHDISPTLKLHWVVWRCVRWIGDQRCGYLFQNKWCIGFSTSRHHNILQDSKKKYKFCRWIGWFIKKVHKWKSKLWKLSFLSILEILIIFISLFSLKQAVCEGSSGRDAAGFGHQGFEKPEAILYWGWWGVKQMQPVRESLFYNSKA